MNLTRNQLFTVVCLALAVGTLGLYWPVIHHGFITLDDEDYVTKNFYVRAGLTWPGAVWAFTSVYADNWHPLTWIFHMLDCQLYGLNPGGHHLTNVFFHIANALLLFWWLNGLTNASWRSAFVAALFAWHPLHLESVAWVSELKDVLSTFFWLLTLIAYTHYVKKPRVAEYFLTLLLFGFGLMSKPMVVTLPFVLLLIDFWPLNRFQLPRPGAVAPPNAEGVPLPNAAAAKTTRLVAGLILEKLPFFALTLMSCVVTYLIQKRSGAVLSLDSEPFYYRIANALVAYTRYICKSVWPSDLTIIYPLPHHWPVSLVSFAVLLLATCSGLFVLLAKRHPYLIMGWCWYLGTLFPTIGIVQVGSQAWADRYMYIPSIGLFILITWGWNDLLSSLPQRRKITALGGSLALASCLVCTSIQLKYWQDSITLFEHAIEITADNYVAYTNLGAAFNDIGQTDKALNLLVKAVQLAPNYATGQNDLGVVLVKKGQLDEAIRHFDIAAQIRPNDPEFQFNLGTTLLNAGKPDEAMAKFSTALRLKPYFTDAQLNWGIALLKEGKAADAIPHFSTALQLEPNNPEAHFDLGLALLQQNQPDEAAVQFTEELKLTPNATKGHYRLAQAFSQLQKPGEAVQHYREVVRLTPDFPEALNELAWILATDPDSRIRDSRDAIQFAKRACELTQNQQPATLTTLSVAYADAGQFSEAIATAQRAFTLATKAGQKEIAATDAILLKLYQSQQPFREAM